MQVPEKIKADLLSEANKYARFSWYNGWEKASGYIKSELSDDIRYGSVRIYIKWEKKKVPTDEQIKSEIEKAIDGLLNNEDHHQVQKEFRRYIQNKYMVDVRRLKHQVELSIVENLTHVIKAIESYEDMELPCIQELLNDLKNLEAGVSDEQAIEYILDQGKKRVGEA